MGTVDKYVSVYEHSFDFVSAYGCHSQLCLLDIIVGLTESPFLYDLYYLRHDQDDSCFNMDIFLLTDFFYYR